MMKMPKKRASRVLWGNSQRNELRYLRRDGNRMVRARRRRRTALRVSLTGLLWAALAIGGVAAFAAAGRLATSPNRFRLSQVIVRGNQEAGEEEIRKLAQDWMGRNLLVITLTDVEKKIREHPWIGEGGSVRIARRLPGTLVITVGERKATGLALLGGVVWLLDGRGMPIDRHGPRYADCDFPIIKGLDAVRARPEQLRAALAEGVAVTRALTERQPGFVSQVSEIDVSEPDMIVLRLDDESYDLRLSRQEYMKNLENYFALRDQFKGDDGAIDYVDLRWQDRIAVMPAVATSGVSDSQRPVKNEQGNGGR